MYDCFGTKASAWVTTAMLTDDAGDDDVPPELPDDGTES